MDKLYPYQNTTITTTLLFVTIQIVEIQQSQKKLD